MIIKKFNFNIYKVTTWKKKNWNTYIANISRSKVNQIIKFGQLIETFFMKHYTQNEVEKLFPDPVLKSRNWAYLWANSLQFYLVCFHCVPSWKPSNYIESYCRVLAFTSYEAFSKNKKRSWISCSIQNVKCKERRCYEEIRFVIQIWDFNNNMQTNSKLQSYISRL